MEDIRKITVGGTTYHVGALHPVPKTEAMTAPVGTDEAGQLFAEKDGELLDIRSGYYGRQYESAGEAVRDQVGYALEGLNGVAEWQEQLEYDLRNKQGDEPDGKVWTTKDGGAGWADPQRGRIYETALDVTVTEDTGILTFFDFANTYTGIVVSIDQSGIEGTSYFTDRFGVLNEAREHKSPRAYQNLVSSSDKYKTISAEIVGLDLVRFQGTGNNLYRLGYSGTQRGIVFGDQLALQAIGGLVFYAGSLKAGTNIKVFGWR